MNSSDESFTISHANGSSTVQVSQYDEKDSSSSSDSSKTSNSSSKNSNSSSSSSWSGTSSQKVVTPVNNGQSTPTSSAKNVSDSSDQSSEQPDRIKGTMQVKASQNKHSLLSGRLPQTDEQRAGVVVVGLLLLGSVLSYFAWKRNRS